jgi:Mn-dependent DtxR family transcriptional regulator
MTIETIATTEEVLQFIHDAHFIQPWELANQFGYTQRGAEDKIYELHKAGLVINSIYGKWNLTTRGERRLDYYNAHQKKDRIAVQDELKQIESVNELIRHFKSIGDTKTVEILEQHRVYHEKHLRLFKERLIQTH